MTYFQNLFAQDYLGYMMLGDKSASAKWTVKGNFGRNQDWVAVFTQPSASNTYNLSGNDTAGNSKAVLSIAVALSVNDFRDWCVFNVSIAGVIPAATTVDEIIALLNANTTFSSYFTAYKMNFSPNLFKLVIKNKLSEGRMKFFIVNGRAEEVLKFNARAGVAELPTYFHRHVIGLELTNAERQSYLDGVNLLHTLDPSNNVDAAIITAAGFDPGTVQEDWQLLKGTSGMFMFTGNTYDGSGRIIEKLEHQAGAVVGDLAKKTLYTYTGVATVPDTVCQIPYTLQSGDLITP